MTSQQQRFCPLCDQSFDGGEAVLRCDGCGVLHHPSCWVKHGGCATQPAHLSTPIAMSYSQGRPSGAPAPHPGEGLRAVPRSFAPIPDAGTQRPEALGSRTGDTRERAEAVRPRVAPPAAPSDGGPREAAKADEVVGARRQVHQVAPDAPLPPAPGQGRRYAVLNKAERYPPSKTLPKVYGRHGILAYWYVPVAALVAVAVAFSIIWAVDRLVGGDDSAASGGNGAGAGGPGTTTTPVAGGNPGGSTPAPADGTAAPAGKLTIGGAAVVTGTGDCLNVRVAPGRTNDAIVCLADGQKVTVLEGPEPADNLQWWKVKTNLGDGWAAEDYLAPEPQP